MKNLFTYLKALWGAWGNLQSNDVRHDCRRSDLRRSPSGLDAKWKQNPFMRFAVVLTLIFTIGVGSAWGETSTLTFTAACGGSGTANDGVVWTVTSDAAESTYDDTKGIHYGTGKVAVSYLRLSTSGISGTITKIVVNTSGASSTLATVSVTVGGSAYGGAAKSITSSAANYTFTGSASGAIQVSITQSSAKKAVYCKSITVTYSAASCTSNPAVGAGSNSSVTATTATVSCASGISSLGSAGCSITDYGFVIGTSANPAIGGSGVTKHQVGTTYTSTGASFSKDLTGLSAETTYYVRPYATNGNGTAYGTQTSFTTPALPKYTVTLKDDNSTYTQASYGASVTLPSRTGCTGYTFAGWTKTWVAPQSSWTTTAPTIIPAGSYTPTANENLYPVYTKTEGGGVVFARYEKVTSAPSDWSGEYLITGTASSTTYTASGSMSSNHISCTALTPSSTEYASYEVTLTKIGATSNYYIQLHDGTYLGSSASNSTDFTVSNSLPDGNNFKWTISTSSIRNVSNTTRYIKLKSTSTYDFRCYISENGNAPSLWKRIEEDGSTTYYISVPGCCTPLGSINGSVSLTQGGNSVTISGWSDVANVGTYTVRMYKKNGASWDPVSGTASGGSAGTAGTRTNIATGSKSVTYTGLVVESEYKFTVQAIAGSASYCDGDETAVTEINSTDVSSTPFKFRYSIYIDNGSNSGWTHHYITPTGNTDEGSVTIDLNAHVDYYQFKIAGGFSGWWGQTTNDGMIEATTVSDWTLDGDKNVRLKTGAAGDYVFTVDYSGTTNPKMGVEYPSADQDAGYVIYYDNSILNWSSLYYRIGNNSNCSKVDAVLVTGTDKFYKITTPDYDNMDAWHIANNYGWTGSNSVYRTKTNSTPAEAAKAITNSISFQQYVVTGDITVIPTTTHSTGGDTGDAGNNNCEFYTINTPTSGMLTHNISVGSADHGTVVATYTNTSGTTGQTVAEGANSDLAHRCIVTITATPDAGYTCSSLTVNGAAFTSGNTHILTADATIAATFTAQTSTVTLDNNNATSGSSQTVTATYDAAMPLTTTSSTPVAALSRTGYTFTGWWDATSGGTQYYSYNAGTGVIASARTWNKTGAQTLKAQWSINSYTLTWETVRGKVTTAGTGAAVDAAGNISSSVEYNTALTAPVCGNANGYTFTGWSPDVADNMPAANTTYTAQWSANVYTVTLDNQSATTAGAASVSATFGQAMPSIASNLPAKTGYRFDGYYTKKNGDGTKYYNADGSSATNMAMYGANPTLYANWVAQIEFSVNGVVDDELTCDVTASLPSSATVPTSCGDCWAFAGWDASSSCSTTPGHAGGENAATHGITTPTTLYAVFGKTVFEWISSTSGLVDKDYYVLTNIASSKEYALSNTANPTYSSDAASTEVTDKIKENGAGYFLYNPAVNNIWKFTGTTSSGQLQNVGNTSLYLNLSGSGSILSTTNNLTFTLGSNGEWKINSTKYLRHYSANDWDAAASLSEGKFSCYLYHQTSATYATEPSCETYDIVWKVDGTPLATGSQTEETNTCAGIEELPEDPDDDALDCATKFVGWSEEELVGAGHDAPADLFTSVGYAPVIEEDKTFHAVFATGTPIANTYVLGTIDDLKDGQTVILVNYANDVACKNTSSSTGTLDALDISSLIDDDVLTTDNTAVKWMVTKSGDYYVFKSGDNYLRCSGSSNLVCDATSDKWTITSGSVDGTYYMTSYNQSSYKFEYYNSKFTTYSGTGTAYNTVFYIPAESYSDYMTTCCDDVVTIGAPTITGSGTVTFASGGETLTEGDVVETCTASKTITATVTPAAGYSCTALSFTDGSSALTTSPTILSSVPFDAPTAKDYDMTFATNTTSMTLTTSATFSVKPLTAWTWGYRIDADAKNNTGDILPIPVDPIEAYIGQYVRFDITGYTPSDVIAAKQNYVYDQDANPKQPVYDTDELAHVGHSTGYYTTRGKAAGDATLIFKSVGNAEITQTMTIRVKALPTVTFVDNIHNKTDFAVTEGVLAAGGVLTSVVTTGVVDHDLKTPKHADVAMPVSGNECEQQHLHLVGWIYSEWSGAADYMAGTGSKPSVSALTGAKVGTAEGFPDNTPCFFEPNDDINMETWNGKTFYAVWAIVE